MIAKQVTAPNELDIGLNLSTEKTRRRELLEEMNRVVPLSALVALIEPHAPRACTSRRPFGIETMLRVHFLVQWFSLSDPAMEEALPDVPLYREFADPDGAVVRLPEETTILRFGGTTDPRQLLEAHDLAARMLGAVNDILTSKGLMLRAGTAVDATLIAPPSSTKNKNKDETRDPEMHQTKKGSQWDFGMNAHIGVDAVRGWCHTVVGTAASVNNVTQGHALLHGQEQVVFADAGYQGAITRQFGFVKVRDRGLAKNTAQLKTLFALSNLRMARIKGRRHECVRDTIEVSKRKFDFRASMKASLASHRRQFTTEPRLRSSRADHP